MKARWRPEWTSDELFARRRELYVRAAPVFLKHGYRGATLKALANACGLSIPALYRYFPSKRAFALYPLVSLYPELHAPRPDATTGDPLSRLSSWIRGSRRRDAALHPRSSLLREAGSRRSGAAPDRQEISPITWRSSATSLGAPALIWTTEQRESSLERWSTWSPARRSPAWTPSHRPCDVSCGRCFEGMACSFPGHRAHATSRAAPACTERLFFRVFR